MEENLVSVLEGGHTLTTQSRGRHLVILKSWERDNIAYESIDFSRLWSLTVFGKWEPFFISESMKLLRVLDLEDASDVRDADLDKMVKLLHHLKFLSLRGCREICHLPSSLGDLRNLQTLDVRGTSIVTLPISTTKLKKLQYIRAGGTTVVQASMPSPIVSSYNCFPHFFCSRRRHLAGVMVPRGIEKLEALQTLGVINISASAGGAAFLKDPKKLIHLRKLGVSGINKHNSKEFFSVMSALGQLESLSVWLDENSQACLDVNFLYQAHLCSLKLYGLQEKLPASIEYLGKLRKLDLEMGNLNRRDIELLAQLPELCVLRLRVKQQLQDDKLHFYDEMYGEELVTFKKVKILEIACSSSELQVTFGSRSMNNLELLTIDYSSSTSYKLAGLNSLSELKQVLLKGTDDEAFRAEFASHLASHPMQPVVKLEEQLLRSS
ncbi:unnamed protein product [Triticum turgidum subsp. durum]|uniref:Disease resistance R13L4/SHOC-2-like LRR domain-containing protein n=1 Tax=Triticum turgidum subsp. durum TaxID=4567 RepID=A0A9R1AER1_TRITD|nr:unnamed protein product [Triticum turgidum subsp. durum]